MPLPWVIVIVVILMAIRFALGRVKTGWAKTIAETAESLALAVALVFLIIRPFLVQAYFIPSESMEPTLLKPIPGSRPGDHLLANKAIYRLRAPKHGEIVVFKAPPALEAEEGKKDFIKRCIGEPGDTIQVKQGFVMINGIDYNHDQMRSELEDYDNRLKFFPDYVLAGDEKLSKKRLAGLFHISESKITIHPGVVFRNGKALVEPYINEDPDYDWGPEKAPKDSFFMMGDNRNNSKDSHVWSFLPRKYVEGKAMFIFWPLNRIRIIR